jgi:hypothetical protein
MSCLENVPLWIASASLSGISMLNSYTLSESIVVDTLSGTDLLNRHDHLHSIKTIETEIVVKVRLAVEL